MSEIEWHVRLTMDSSMADRIKEIAKVQRRTPANYIMNLIEADQREKEKPVDP